jgi:hypothetical protein
MRFVYPGNPDLAVDSWSEIRGRFPSHPASEIWMEWYLYVPANYVHRGAVPANNKFWIVGYDDKMHNGWSEPGGWTVRMEINPESTQGNISRGRLVYGNASTGGSSSWDLDQPSPSGIIKTEDLGAWVRYGVHVRLATSQNAADGEINVWRNGLRVSHNIGVPLASGSFAKPINCFELMGWANSGFTEETVFYIDDIRIYGANPGW